MKWKTIYLILCVAGVVLPYWQFIPWVAANGIHGFFPQLFANRVSGFFAMDVLVSAFALLLFVRAESARLNIQGLGRWLPLLALLMVGVSFSLPLFLYIRELKLEQTGPGTRTATA